MKNGATTIIMVFLGIAIQALVNVVLLGFDFGSVTPKGQLIVAGLFIIMNFIYLLFTRDLYPSWLGMTILAFFNGTLGVLDIAGVTLSQQLIIMLLALGCAFLTWQIDSSIKNSTL